MEYKRIVKGLHCMVSCKKSDWLVNYAVGLFKSQMKGMFSCTNIRLLQSLFAACTEWGCPWMEFYLRFTGLGANIILQVTSVCLFLLGWEIKNVRGLFVFNRCCAVKEFKIYLVYKDMKCSPRLPTPWYPESLMRTRMERVRDHQNKDGN